MSDLFDPLFDLQDAHLKKLDHPFEELQHLIPWEIFRPELDTVYQKERKSNAGVKPNDVVIMFKGWVVQTLYGSVMISLNIKEKIDEAFNDF